MINTHGHSVDIFAADTASATDTTGTTASATGTGTADAASATRTADAASAADATAADTAGAPAGRRAGTPPGRRLIVAGTIAAIIAMVGEARLGPRDPQASDPSSWWGILPSAPPSDTVRGVLAATAVLAVIALCLTWVILLRHALRHALPARTAAVAALAWATPFAVGPPLFSRDVYAYAAQGELARYGLDPATHGIGDLLSPEAAGTAGAAFVAAVDPRWRETHAPYGGLAVGVERFAAAVGNALGSGPANVTVVLRIIAVVSTVALVLLMLRLWRRPGPLTAGTGSLTAASSPAGTGTEPGPADSYASIVLVLLAANPFVIIHLIGGAHLDALAAALLAAALVVDRMRIRERPSPRHHDLLLGAAAVALACLAGSVKATAFLGVAWLVVAHARDGWRRSLGADVAAGTIAVVAASAAGGFGPTWLGALATSGKLETGVAPASILATAAGALGHLVGLDVTDDSLLRATRALTLLTAGLIVGWLLLRAWSRPPASGHRDDLAVVGYGGMAVALGSPVLYPWYLALSVPFLAALVALAALDRRTRAVLALVVVTSVWLCAATLSPLAATWRLLGRAGAPGAVAAAALVLLALAAAAPRVQRRAARRR
ncbi:hypothetical protein CcI49_21350 [Frankia sp. CcI49]|nr:hypothetical protein CcI49_21350 [Frankia sp. CcI49]